MGDRNPVVLRDKQFKKMKCQKLIINNKKKNYPSRQFKLFQHREKNKIKKKKTLNSKLIETYKPSCIKTQEKKKCNNFFKRRRSFSQLIREKFSFIFIFFMNTKFNNFQ